LIFDEDLYLKFYSINYTNRIIQAEWLCSTQSFKKGNFRSWTRQDAAM